jgi:zinc protease
MRASPISRRIPPRAEDLERVKTQLIAEAIYAQDNQATMARWYGGALTSG